MQPEGTGPSRINPPPPLLPPAAAPPDPAAGMGTLGATCCFCCCDGGWVAAAAAVVAAAVAASGAEVTPSGLKWVWPSCSSPARGVVTARVWQLLSPPRDTRWLPSSMAIMPNTGPPSPLPACGWCCCWGCVATTGAATPIPVAPAAPAPASPALLGPAPAAPPLTTSPQAAAAATGSAMEGSAKVAAAAVDGQAQHPQTVVALHNSPTQGRHAFKAQAQRLVCCELPVCSWYSKQAGRVLPQPLQQAQHARLQQLQCRALAALPLPPPVC